VAIVEKNRPYVAMLFVQFVYAGMALLSKAAISKGMSPYVFVVYRQAFASVALSPFAFFDRFQKLVLHSSPFLTLTINMLQKYHFFANFMHNSFCSKQSAPLSCNLLCKLFLVSLVG